jgi:hypothetical protein
MMESQSDLKFLRLLENIRHHFAFLFKRGFQLVSIIFVDQNCENWQVTMATDNCIIKVYSYMGKVDLALRIPQLHGFVGLLELSDFVYGNNVNEDFSGPAEEPPTNETQSIQRIAQLLDKYIDDILEKIQKMLNLLSFNDPPIPFSKLAQRYQQN